MVVRTILRRGSGGQKHTVAPVLCYAGNGTKSFCSPTTWAETERVMVNETGNYPGPSVALIAHEQHPGIRRRWTRLYPQLGRRTLYAEAESAVSASSPFRFLLVRTRTGPLLSQFVSTIVAVVRAPHAARD
jgi:hypothetical protein